MSEVLIVKNIPREDPGLLANLLQEEGVDFATAILGRKFISVKSCHSLAS